MANPEIIYGVRRQAQRDAAFVPPLGEPPINPKRRRAALAAALQI